MANTKRLPLFILNGKHKGPMISLVTRVLIVVAVNILVVTVILLTKFGVTWNAVSTAVWGIPISSAIVASVNYLFWRPRYRVL